MKATYGDAIDVIRQLVDAKNHAYLAGGCVRDRLSGIEPMDYDITTSALPEEIQSIFPKTIPVGASFGVVKVVVSSGAELDVATFRTDGQYSDMRRPDSVQYTKSAEEDVRRRDFTINALLMDIDGNILDYVGGQQDLKNRILRTVGNPLDRFAEDALRMMRAIRFSTRFRMEIEPATWEAIERLSPNIKEISKERITDELTKTFSYGHCDESYLKLHKSNLWHEWFDGFILDNDDNWNAILSLSNVKPNEDFLLSMEIILTEAHYYRYSGHLERLSLTNNQKKVIESLHERANVLRRFEFADLADQRKIMQWEDLSLVMRFLECEKHNGRQAWDFFCNEQKKHIISARMEEVKALGWPAPLITGDTLLEMGFIAGPVFTKMLDLVRDKQLNGELTRIEDVKPFLVNTFPAAPRKLDNGDIRDDTRFRRLMAACANCGKPMVINIAKTPEGQYIWNDVKDKINIHGSTNRFYWSGCCYTRKSKSKFVEVQI